MLKQTRIMRFIVYFAILIIFILLSFGSLNLHSIYPYLIIVSLLISSFLFPRPYYLTQLLFICLSILQNWNAQQNLEVLILSAVLGTMGAEIIQYSKSQKSNRLTYELNSSRSSLITNHNQISMEGLLSNLPGMAYRCLNNHEWTMKFVSEGCLELTGYEAGDLIENQIIAYGDLIHSDDKDRVWETVQSHIKEHNAFQLTYRIATSSGEEKWVWEQGRVTSKNQLDQEIIEGFITDITKRIQANRALKRSEIQYKSLTNSITDLFFAIDHKFNLTYWNKASEDLTGIQAKDAIGKSLYEIFPFIKSTSFEQIFNEVFEEGKPSRTISPYPFGDTNIFLEINAYPLFNGLAAFCKDVTKQIEYEKKLKYMSTHDILTGIYNRAYFETELERLQHSRLYPVSIVIADLDDLKKVNDTRGHAAGDQLIKYTAKILKETLRAEDVVARIGGDEFGILIWNSDVHSITRTLKRVQQKISEHNRSNTGLNIHLSIGVATTRNQEALEETFRRADIRMYVNKGRFKNLNYNS